MIDGEKFSMSYIFDAGFSQEYKNDIFQSTKFSFGGRLIEKIVERPHPLVIEIEEKIVPIDSYMSVEYPRNAKYIISANIIPVNYKHITIEIPNYISRSATFFEKLKWLFSK